ncbi:MAG: hypothetical protein FWH55_13890 [Oscillospiraceae bacterium]|nr:hypothetical protein [Oscillospiraceae bacterium]
MTEQAKIRMAEKSKRVEAATKMEVPDKIPFGPLTGYYPAGAYGISYYDLMIDPRHAIPGIKQFIADFDPDMAMPPVAYCIPACETSGATFLRWPGPTFGISNFASFQVLDQTYLHDDEYDEFLKDPTGFQIRKILPRRHAKLKGFEKLDFTMTTEFLAFENFGVMAQPDVKESIMAAIASGEQINLYNARLGECFGAIIEEGIPLFMDSLAIAPYDIFSDDFRGLMKTLTDMHERPEKLDAALEYTTQAAIDYYVPQAAAASGKRVFIPLHAGVDEFMSAKNYERFYWKGLRKLCDALIDAGTIPMLFCEGNYNTRLEIISEFEKGKVMYIFEKVDIKKAKATAGKVGCIHGNFPNAMLIEGTTEEVVEHTKYMIDILGPGGGFIMCCGIALDNAKKENVYAWREATEKYGKY